LHVYRTYVEPSTERIDDEDRRANAVLPRELRDVVELERRSPELDEFVVRWQQITGPVMAKGVEDTAFYRYFRLTALNEVGGNPERLSLDPDGFHAASRERLERFPRWLLASQTHDTKRAGDVRARIGALSVMHERWAEDRRHGRPERGVPRVADARRRVAYRAAQARALSREGAA
jgi:(1->4)-alpha-D-glucan 1-alpha-D-glucosylmutase